MVHEQTAHLVRIALGGIRGSSDRVKTDQFSQAAIRISSKKPVNLLKQYSVHMYGLRSLVDIVG